MITKRWSLLLVVTLKVRWGWGKKGKGKKKQNLTKSKDNTPPYECGQASFKTSWPRTGCATTRYWTKSSFLIPQGLSDSFGYNKGRG